VALDAPTEVLFRSGLERFMRRNTGIQEREPFVLVASISWDIPRDSIEEPRVDATLFRHRTRPGQNFSTREDALRTGQRSNDLIQVRNMWHCIGQSVRGMLPA